MTAIESGCITATTVRREDKHRHQHICLIHRFWVFFPLQVMRSVRKQRGGLRSIQASSTTRSLNLRSLQQHVAAHPDCGENSECNTPSTAVVQVGLLEEAVKHFLFIFFIKL